MRRQDFVLPAIHREFIWPPDEVRSLFGILLQKYPIGSFLFWKVEEEQSQVVIDSP